MHQSMPDLSPGEAPGDVGDMSRRYCLSSDHGMTGAWSSNGAGAVCDNIAYGLFGSHVITLRHGKDHCSIRLWKRTQEEISEGFECRIREGRLEIFSKHSPGRVDVGDRGTVQHRGQGECAESPDPAPAVEVEGVDYRRHHHPRSRGIRKRAVRHQG